MNKIDMSGRRLLKILSRRMTSGFAFVEHEKEFKVHAQRTFRFPLECVQSLEAQGAILLRENHAMITRSGLEMLKQNAGLGAVSDPQAESAKDEISSHRPAIKTTESPLMRLVRRSTKTGAAYLSADEYHAGERLRIEFERGNLQPRITANYEMAAGSSGQGGVHQAIKLSDFAIDYRNKVNNAVKALGPELSGVALDVCCFLKGLEAVERERQWPPRSAKLMLKTALASLARHYGITSPNNGPINKIGSWSSVDYRPNM